MLLLLCCFTVTSWHQAWSRWSQVVCFWFQSFECVGRTCDKHQSTSIQQRGDCASQCLLWLLLGCVYCDPCVQILSSLYPAMESLVDQLVSTLTQLTGAADLRKLRKLCDRLHPSIHNGRLTNIDDCLMEVQKCHAFLFNY